MLHVPRRILALIPVVLLMKPDPAAAASNPTLEALANEYWQEFLEDNPTEATALGDHRYDARLPDPSPVGRDRMTGRLESMIDRTRELDPARLDPDDRVTRLALIEEISGRLSRLECRLEEWNVDPLNGPQVDLVNLVDETRMASPEDAANFVKRCRAIPDYMKLLEDNLRTGLGLGKVAPRAAVVKVIGQLEDMDREPVKDSAFLKPLLDPANNLAGKDAYRKELLQVLGDDVRPAFRGYLDFLKTEVLPRSRPDSLAGMKYLPGGDDAYRKLIRVETSLDRSPAEIHEIGLQEIARIRKEMSELGGRVLGTTDFDQIRERMRTDPSMYFSTAQEVEDKARSTLAKAKAALPAWFSTLPKTDCIVQVMGMHEAPTSYVGYYREPSADGTRPGCYMINTYKPETRTRYEAEALAFHESIPGHHLQIVGSPGTELEFAL